MESTCALCPWSLALASSIPVLGLESVCPRKGCPWPWPWPRIFFVSLALASSLVSSTPPLVIRNVAYFFVVTSQECIPGHLDFSYKFHLYFCKQEMRYCSEDAPRTGERNVNCNKKTTSENVVLNKISLNY